LSHRIEEAASGLLASFAAGIAQDRDAVGATIVGPWSNSRAAARSPKLKLVKGQMCGRAKIDQ
jgi:transposase